MAQDYFYDVENLSYNLINYGVYDYLSPYKRISTNDIMTWDGDVLTIKGSVGASNISTYIFRDKFHLPFQVPPQRRLLRCRRQDPKAFRRSLRQEVHRRPFQ